jgi:hypothetical protein
MTRGKVGGTVFSHNSGGDYAKNNQKPIDTGSARSSQVRAINTTNAQIWNYLTDAQRTAWNNATANFPRTNEFGDTYFLSGETLFISLCDVLLNTGNGIILNPPTPQYVQNIFTLSVAATPGVMTLTFAPTPTLVTQSLVVYATPPLSAGITNFERELRQIAVLAGGTASPASIFAAYLAKYGVAPAVGSRVGVMTQPALNANGLQGAKLIASTIQT